MLIFLKDIASIIAIGLILGFVGYWSSSVYSAWFSNSEFIIKGTEAFFGAFTAYLFVRIGEFFTRRYDRLIKHHNALVTLDIQLNELVGIINENLFSIKHFQKAILSGNIYWGELNQLPIDKSHLTSLYDITIINEVFRYFYNVRVLNEDISNLQRGYQELKSAYVQKQINITNYVQNAQLISENLSLYEKFLEHNLEMLKRLIARVRIQIKRDEPLGAKIMKLSYFSSGKYISEKDIDKELSALTKEIAEVSEKSRKEKDDILRRGEHE